MPRHSAAQNEPGGSGSPFTSSSTSTSGPDGQEEDGFAKATRGALIRKAAANGHPRPFVGGPLLGRVEGLRALGLERVLELVAAAPGGLGVPMILQWVEAHADAGGAVVDLAALEAQLATVRRTIATFQAEDGEAPERLLLAEAELAGRLASAGGEHNG